MKIFKGAMTATSFLSPLQNQQESWVDLCHIDDLLDRIGRTVFEGDVFQPDSLAIRVGTLDRRYPGAKINPSTRSQAE